VLQRAPVFAGIPRRLLGRLATRLFEKTYEAGEVVFREGETGRGLFIVVAGSVEVVRTDSNGERRLAICDHGAAFGELALIDDLPRSATARALGRARLLILYRAHFEALIEGERAVAIVVMRNLLRLLAGYLRTGGRDNGRPDLESLAERLTADLPEPPVP
jgi:CRP/FNR family transcriptional regulator, cyclic AMP receptor protein